MAIILPFRAVRPAKDKVHLVVSRPVDSYSAQQLHSKLSENPYTFLHIIKPEFGTEYKSKPNSPALLKKIKKKFIQFRRKKIFITEKQECFYVYRQKQDKNIFTGIIARASVQDYENGMIRRHEQTLADREEKLKSYLELCDFNAEPVCLFYYDNKKIAPLVSEIISGKPVYRFTTVDRIQYTLWKVNTPEMLRAVTAAFASVSPLYIADGHHRCASSARLAKWLREKNPSHGGNEPYNFFMAALFHGSELRVYEFNRLVRDLNGCTPAHFYEKLSETFFIEEKESGFKPTCKGVFGMYMEKKWYALKEKAPSPRQTDAEILSEKILSPLLNIRNLRRDKRIMFINGTEGTEALQKAVDTGKAKAAFLLYPVSVDEIKSIADAGATLPPKTTFVEPKLRSGLTIYSLSG